MRNEREMHSAAPFPVHGNSVEAFSIIATTTACYYDENRVRRMCQAVEIRNSSIRWGGLLTKLLREWKIYYSFIKIMSLHFYEIMVEIKFSLFEHGGFAIWKKWFKKEGLKGRRYITY